jgi:dTDP-4-dehydrorhamnose reductase
MKILIIGASGFLGTKLKKILSKRHEVIGTSRNLSEDILLDATIEEDVIRILKENKPEVVIDTVALTNSVLCEKDPKLARKINFITVKNIRKACCKYNSKLIFISSSYVFDGVAGNFEELSITNPTNTYAKTKLIAEKEVLKSRDSIVLRVDQLYGYNDKNSPNGIIGKLLSDDEIFLGNPFQIRSPIWINDLAIIIENLIVEKKSGIFHASGDERITMIDFLKKINSKFKIQNKLIILDEQILLVKPLKNSSLKNSSLKNIQIRSNSIDDALNFIKAQLK